MAMGRRLTGQDRQQGPALHVIRDGQARQLQQRRGYVDQFHQGIAA